MCIPLHVNTSLQTLHTGPLMLLSFHHAGQCSVRHLQRAKYQHFKQPISKWFPHFRLMWTSVFTQPPGGWWRSFVWKKTESEADGKQMGTEIWCKRRCSNTRVPLDALHYLRMLLGISPPELYLFFFCGTWIFPPAVPSSHFVGKRDLQRRSVSEEVCEVTVNMSMIHPCGLIINSHNLLQAHVDAYLRPCTSSIM